jgi:hypothetical protein
MVGWFHIRWGQRAAAAVAADIYKACSTLPKIKQNGLWSACCALCMFVRCACLYNACLACYMLHAFSTVTLITCYHCLQCIAALRSVPSYMLNTPKSQVVQGCFAVSAGFQVDLPSLQHASKYDVAFTWGPRICLNRISTQ